MYRTLMEQQRQPWNDIKVPHSTTFKEHLLSLLPECIPFFQGKEVYLSKKTTTGEQLAKLHDNNDEDDALLLRRTAVILHRLCLQKQEPFGGCFSTNCLTSPNQKELHSFINVILQGTSIQQDQENYDNNEHAFGRAKIACIISQLLIYNTYSGTYHASQSDTIRHGKEREMPFLLYQGLKMHGEARLKKQIEKTHDLTF